MVVGDDTIQYGIFNGTFQLTHLGARGQVEGTHDFLPIYGRLEVAYAVALLQVFQLLTDELEVGQEAALALRVFGSDVGFAQRHKVVNIITRLKKQAAHGRVGDLLIGYDYGTHVQAYELLHVFHLLVHGQLHLAEDDGHHLLAHIVVVVERPPHPWLPALSGGLADVVKQSSPAQPQVGGYARHIVHHLKRVVEIVLVRPPIFCFHPPEGGQFGKNEFEQPRAFQVYQPARRLGREDYLVQLVGNALARDDGYTLQTPYFGSMDLTGSLEADNTFSIEVVEGTETVSFSAVFVEEAVEPEPSGWTIVAEHTMSGTSREEVVEATISSGQRTIIATNFGSVNNSPTSSGVALIEGLPYCWGVASTMSKDYVGYTVAVEETGTYKFSFQSRLTLNLTFPI